MQLVDRSRLKGEIYTKKICVSKLCKDKLKMSRQLFYKKLNGQGEFKESEIATLITIFSDVILFEYPCSKAK